MREAPGAVSPLISAAQQDSGGQRQAFPGSPPGPGLSIPQRGVHGGREAPGCLLQEKGCRGIIISALIFFIMGGIIVSSVPETEAAGAGVLGTVRVTMSRAGVPGLLKVLGSRGPSDLLRWSRVCPGPLQGGESRGGTDRRAPSASPGSLRLGALDFDVPWALKLSLPRPNGKLLLPKYSPQGPGEGSFFISLSHFWMQELVQGPGLLL